MVRILNWRNLGEYNMEQRILRYIPTGSIIIFNGLLYVLLETSKEHALLRPYEHDGNLVEVVCPDLTVTVLLDSPHG